jgi:hypothetical protein
MSKNKPDPWHFARPELAQKYLQTFEIGLISAQALFALRELFAADVWSCNRTILQLGTD